MYEDNFVDEFHIIFACKNDDIVRLKDMYIPDYYKNRPSVYKCFTYANNSCEGT